MKLLGYNSDKILKHELYVILNPRNMTKEDVLVNRQIGIQGNLTLFSNNFDNSHNSLLHGGEMCLSQCNT